MFPASIPAIRAVTIRALREGYEVIGLRRGWASLIDMVRDPEHDNSDNFQRLTEELVNRAGRTGGTFLHTSRTNPSRVKQRRRSRAPAPSLYRRAQRSDGRGAEESRLAEDRLPHPHRRR